MKTTTNEYAKNWPLYLTISVIVILAAPYVPFVLLAVHTYYKWDLIAENLTLLKAKLKQAIQPINEAQNRPGNIYLLIVFIIGMWAINASSSVDYFSKLIVFFFTTVTFLTFLIYWTLKFGTLKNIVSSHAFSIFFFSISAAMVWNAKSEVSSLLNSAFGIDPSNFPLALSAGIFLRYAGYLSIPVLLYAFFLEVALFLFIFNSEPSSKEWKAIALFFLKFISSIALFSIAYASYTSMERFGLSKESNEIILKIAYDKDFSSRFDYCALENKPKDSGAIFISSLQSRALIISRSDFNKAIQNHYHTKSQVSDILIPGRIVPCK
ncbi:hypothetical protein VA599_01610 [Chromobacterium sp. TRC.1.1.SA]|uniref:Uncharacterized protein n=1 Tax=Chromobacterium indicum TaxID=3110228 RepID=A0ABV0CEY9_9NEIS